MIGRNINFLSSPPPTPTPMTHQDDFLKLKGDITFHLEALLIQGQALHQKEKQLKKLRQQHNSNSHNPRSCDPFQGQNILVSQRSGHDTDIGPPRIEETEPSKLIEFIGISPFLQMKVLF